MPITIRQIRISFWILDLILVALSVFFLVGAAQNLFVSPNVAPEPLSEPPTAKAVGGHSQIRTDREYASLKKSNLFGARSLANVAPKKAIKKKLPVTSLELELLGCVSTGSPETSFAIIRNKKTRKEDTYSVGDYIKGIDDVKLEEIRRNEVIISRGGVSKSLPMKFGESTDITEAKPSAKTRQIFGRNRQSKNPNARVLSQAAEQPITVRSENVRIVNREKLMEDIIQSFGSLNDLDSLKSKFSTSPNIVNNKPSGVKVEMIGSDPILSQSGLRVGDIVKRINGNNVNSLQDIISLNKRLQRAPEIRVYIERDGRHTNLIYKIH